MKATSDQIAMTLENARLYGRLNESYRSLDQSKQEIEAYSKALDAELEKGRQIQRDFLPQFEIRQVQIEPGDILIGYTDGVIDALAPNGELFTRKRLLSIIEQTPSSASDLVDRIKTSVSTHVHNAPPSDDITMLAVKRLALDLN
jgi:serine phosphatase RsbU (regulator of sigma subunit)